MDLTIIIPAYNSEHTIINAISSIITNIPDAYIIVVNDGSTDQTKKVVEDFINHKSKIRLINKQNGGVSSARNLGLEMTKTKYVMFLDSDDYIDSDVVIFFDRLKHIDYDLAIGGHKIINDNSQKKCLPRTYFEGDIDNFLDNINAREYRIFLQYVWGKVFSSQLIKENKIKFDEKLHHGEDSLFIFEYLKYSKDIYIVDSIIVNYVNMKNSLSKTKDINLYMEYDRINDKLIDVYSFRKLKQNLKLFELRTVLHTINMFTVLLRMTNMTNKEKIHIIRMRINEFRVRNSFLNTQCHGLQEKIVKYLVINKRYRSIFYFFLLKKFLIK